jgi:hypothetical protein
MSAFDVFGFETFFAGDNVKVDLVAFVQRPKTLALNGAVVNKDVLAAFLRYETKPVLIVEPLYFAAGHNAVSPGLEPGGTEVKKRHNGTYVVFDYIWSRIRLNYAWTIKRSNALVKDKLFTTYATSLFSLMISKTSR